VSTEIFASRKDELFPLSFRNNPLSKLIAAAHEEIANSQHHLFAARIPGKFSPQIFKQLVEHYSDLPELVETPPEELVRQTAKDLLSHAPRWRSPWLQYNIGTAPNTAAVALYAAALDENMININEGNAGNGLVAEKATANIMLALARVQKKGAGLFTFGGTGTNLYALRVGICKSDPRIICDGLKSNTVVFITEDAHFSHHSTVDWLGIGRQRLIIMPATLNRRTDIRAAECMFRQSLTEGKRIGGILLNGGTTYWHTIDSIQEFAKLRDTLVREFDLPYKPHIHVDTVIGWGWLMYEGYDFDLNTLSLEADILSRIQIQYNRIAELPYADSWGIDFHKGIGGSPVDTSMIIFNDQEDLAYLAKSGSIEGGLHQLAQDEDYPTPSEYTLETSRSSGPALGALVSLHSTGKDGFRKHLATLLRAADRFRRVLCLEKSAGLAHVDDLLGFASMVRLFPPECAVDPRREIEFWQAGDENAAFTKEVNHYLKKFFEWDYSTRMLHGEGFEYSFSKSCLRARSGVPVSALKVYPTSPHFDEHHAEVAARLLIDQKHVFDLTIWEKK
jgi:L-2,4-diaminobutyrate decarboxylase